LQDKYFPSNIHRYLFEEFSQGQTDGRTDGKLFYYHNIFISNNDIISIVGN